MLSSNAYLFKNLALELLNRSIRLPLLLRKAIDSKRTLYAKRKKKVDKYYTIKSKLF